MRGSRVTFVVPSLTAGSQKERTRKGKGSYEAGHALIDTKHGWQKNADAVVRPVLAKSPEITVNKLLP